MGILWGSGSIKRSAGQIYETESAYNYIQVLEDDGYRYLRLNEGQGIHSIYHPDEIVFFGPWMQVLAAPFFNEYPYMPHDLERVAIVGLAAGTIARQITEVFGPVPIDGFEIDPQIIQVGKDYFGMNMPNLNPIPTDGRWGLEHSNNLYTIISIDAYRPPYIPWHMTTVEFFQIVYDHLSDDGVLVINVGRAPEDRRLIDGLVGTIGSVFPSLYIMDIPDTFNSIVYATKQPSMIKNLYENNNALLGRDDVHPVLLTALRRTIVNLQMIPESKIVFTDDIAPIEWMTNGMVLNFILFEGVENLQ
jgi:spermidine synthase